LFLQYNIVEEFTITFYPTKFISVFEWVFKVNFYKIIFEDVILKKFLK